jgi:hypothetical protein
MPLIVYLDETGDHSLELVDPGFPVFVLTLLVCDTDAYANQIVPAFYRFKFQHFGHEAVILHSRDIRKAQGDFGFLTDPARRPPFLQGITKIMQETDYRLIATVIRKQRHLQRYGPRAESPYSLSLKLAMERLLPMLEKAGQKELVVVAEARGKREDDALRLTFLLIATGGTEYLPADRFRNIKFRIEFKPKAMNVIGTQMADLAGYPIARHEIDPKKPNPAFDAIRPKFSGAAWGGVWGLKKFP